MTVRIAALAAFVVLVATLLSWLGPRPSTPAGAVTAGRVHGSFQPNDGKLFALVIGNDARSGNPDRSRADAIHLVGINTRSMRAGILNFPRDSWVDVPGVGQSKMNDALYRGGPRLLARTLEGVTGIRIDFWVMTGFEGFIRIIRDLGGVRMNVPHRVFDYGSGARLKAGRQKLKPGEALAYMRSRKTFAQGDITRTTNQGRFLVALLKKLRGDIQKDPATLFRWLATTSRNARSNLSARERFRLGVLATQLRATRVSSVTVPVSVGWAGAASVVFISPEAKSLYRRFEKKGAL